MPAAKLTMLRNAISTRKPARFSERCGVSIAENKVGSSSGGLLGVMGGQYSLDHGKKNDGAHLTDQGKAEEAAGKEGCDQDCPATDGEAPRRRQGQCQD